MSLGEDWRRQDEIKKERSKHCLITWDEITHGYYIHDENGHIVYEVPNSQEVQAKLFDEANYIFDKLVALRSWMDTIAFGAFEEGIETPAEQLAKLRHIARKAIKESFK